MITTRLMHKANLGVSNTPTATPIGCGVLGTEQKQAIQQFSHFRINAIKYTLWPNQNVAGRTVGQSSPPEGPDYASGVEKPLMFSLFVNNRDEKYPDIESIINNPRHKVHSAFRPFTRFTKVKPQVSLNMGNIGVDLLMRNKVWVSTSDLEAEYGRFFYCHNKDTPGTLESYVLHTTVYIQLKNLNVN